jgi:hypothetical protein
LKEEAIEIAEKGADDTGSIGRITRLVRFCCGASFDKQTVVLFQSLIPAELLQFRRRSKWSISSLAASSVPVPQVATGI